MASAKTGRPQTWNRYTYVLNNPPRYVDPDGLNAKDAWSQLTEEEQKIISTKLERKEIPAGGLQTRLEQPQEAFNRLFTGATAEETTALVFGVKNFIDAAGGHSNSEVWQQIGVIDGARVTANDSAAITFRVDDSKKFLAALRRSGFEVDAFYEKAKWFTAEGTHRHSARQITETSKQPGLHFVQDHHHERNRFDSHFDARSSAFKQPDPAYYTRQGEQIDAGKSHYNPYSSVELRRKLREQGIVPRNEP